MISIEALTFFIFLMFFRLAHFWYKYVKADKECIEKTIERSLVVDIVLFVVICFFTKNITCVSFHACTMTLCSAPLLIKRNDLLK